MRTNVKPLNEFLNRDITPAELDVYLAKIEFEYSMLAMGVSIPIAPSDAGEALYYLRMLRESIRQCK